MEAHNNSYVHVVIELPGTLQWVSKLPPGHILMERASTSGMPEVVSGSSITVEPFECIIFHVPSQVQMMPTKFMDVKSVPNIIGHVMCLQTIKDWVNGWLFIVKVQVTWPRMPMSSPDVFLTNGWYPVSRSLSKDAYAE